MPARSAKIVTCRSSRSSKSLFLRCLSLQRSSKLSQQAENQRKNRLSPFRSVAAVAAKQVQNSFSIIISNFLEFKNILLRGKAYRIVRPAYYRYTGRTILESLWKQRSSRSSVAIFIFNAEIRVLLLRCYGSNLEITEAFWRKVFAGHSVFTLARTLSFCFSAIIYSFTV